MKKDNIVKVLPDLYQLTIPVPIKNLGSVFAYLLVDGKENLLIDSGWDDKQSLKALSGGLSEVGLSISDLKTVLISHLHPDHSGLLGEIKKRAPSCKVMMHHMDATTIKQNQKDYVEFVILLHDWLRVRGTPEKELQEMLPISLGFAKSFRPTRPDIEVYGGERLKIGKKWTLQIISAPGHTPGNVCLYELGNSHFFFSGDHILPTITPNVSLTHSYEGDPLGEYLSSLNELKSIETSLVLPSHEYIFSNLRKRIDEIEEHHKHRLELALALLEGHPEGLSAYEIATKLDWSAGSWEKLSAWERRAAIMETIAHLEYLKRRGQITEIQSRLGVSSRITYGNLDCN